MCTWQIIAGASLQAVGLGQVFYEIFAIRQQVLGEQAPWVNARRWIRRQPPAATQADGQRARGRNDRWRHSGR